MTEGPSPLTLVGVVERVTTIPLFPGGTAQSISTWRVDARLVLELHEEGKPHPIARAAIVDSMAFLSGNDIEATEVARRVATQHLLERMATNGVDQLAP